MKTATAVILTALVMLALFWLWGRSLLTATRTPQPSPTPTPPPILPDAPGYNPALGMADIIGYMPAPTSSPVAVASYTPSAGISAPSLPEYRTWRLFR